MRLLNRICCTIVALLSLPPLLSAAAPAAKPAEAEPAVVPAAPDLEAECKEEFDELQQTVDLYARAAKVDRLDVEKADPKTKDSPDHPSRLYRKRLDFEKSQAEAFRKDAAILASDRDAAEVVLRRTEALLSDLERGPAKQSLAADRQELDRLKRSLAATPVAEKSARYDVYVALRRVQRQIALKNPLLDFDKILLVTRAGLGEGHMCDQYFGFHGAPGGGVYVLHDPFGSQPRLQDILSDSIVEHGRLAGKKLPPGAFISPELSFDGRTIYFAYSECGRLENNARFDKEKFLDTGIFKNLDGGWGSPQACYHVFAVQADGARLRQLTDGPWNDFDPCELPDGRIVFISDRRGGQGRCHGGRAVPTYTLFSMNADGSGIVPLSYHETNEWQPSVLNDGMLIYTRWDYVDRGSNEAHHPWICYPDGRDPRARHGNYRPKTASRTHMEMDLRAVPGSRLIVGTAAPHHGQAYGSLILIDPAQEETDRQWPIRRLTPDVMFAESEHGPLCYGTAWPLSEDYHLCVYARAPKAGRMCPHKLYLIDGFGNKVLLYGHKSLYCLGPIPLRPRPAPPVVPNQVDVARRGDTPAGGKLDAKTTGVFACTNVYNSLLPWPKATKIKSLRVVQVFPYSHSSTAFMGENLMTMARSALGTVPVEDDGSVHFEAPAGKVLYFQALDERGLAVQSMKSATWVAPGEKLVCHGCHEPRPRAPAASGQPPLAMRRPPSKLHLECAEADPITFPRLVQPVLDKYCVDCHAKEEKAPSFSARLAGPDPRRDHGWSVAYTNLARFAWSPSGTRSTPGSVGARVSKLYQKVLARDHHDVRLAPEDIRRLTLWLDCNGNFFGAYHDLEAQQAGKLVRPAVE